MKVREVSPLRQKTLDVMTMKGLSPVTQKHYLREIAKFDRHTGHRLDVQTDDAIRDWVLMLIDGGLTPRTTNVTVAALRLFYDTVLGQPEKVAALRFRHVPDRLPRTMPEEDVEHLIQAMTDMRYRMATLVAYGAALRVSEAVSLQIPDIRRNEGLLRIRKGKGNRERMPTCSRPCSGNWSATGGPPGRVPQAGSSTARHPMSRSPQAPCTALSERPATNSDLIAGSLSIACGTRPQHTFSRGVHRRVSCRMSWDTSPRSPPGSMPAPRP